MYKVGDKVEIKQNLVHGMRYNSVVFLDHMRKDPVLTIRDITHMDGVIHYKVYENNYIYTDDMLERILPRMPKTDKTYNFKIVDYRVYNDKVVVVKFNDGTEERAVCCELDKFDLETGVGVCVLKHIFGEDKYKEIIRTSMKQIKAVNKEKERKIEAEKAAAAKKEKAEKHKARRRENKRNRRIAEMKEAYVKALKECGYTGI